MYILNFNKIAQILLLSIDFIDVFKHFYILYLCIFLFNPYTNNGDMVDFIER